MVQALSVSGVAALLVGLVVMTLTRKHRIPDHFLGVGIFVAAGGAVLVFVMVAIEFMNSPLT